MSDYMVVYPRSDRSILATAYVPVWKEESFDLASNIRHETREDAESAARELARKHGLKLDKEIPLLLDDMPAPEPGGAQLYSWKSHAMEGYYPGQIIVMAPNVETARNLARARFEAVERPGYERLVKLEEDLAHEPELLPSGVALIHGSD
jgi:peptidoglycan/xylan/chitin deacetylase (PgdA/CDA1 family)